MISALSSPGFRLSWVLAPSNARRRVPLVRPTTISRPQQGGWRSPGPHRCRPQGSCPSRRFWLRTRHARILANPPLPWRPDASRPCFMPLAPLESPFRAFPSRGAVPALAGLLLPCGFALDPPNGAARTEGFAAPFPVAPTSRRGSPVRAGRTGRPGRRFPGVARTLSVTRCRARFSAPTSRNGRAHRIR